MRQPAGLGCEGVLQLVSDDRVRLVMGVHVGGEGVNCDLKGSLSTPLGHFMVLGTANSVIGDDGATIQTIPGAGGPGMRPGVGVGPEGRFGPGRMGPGIAGMARPSGPEGPGAPGGAVPVEQPARKPNFATSRFAFVVQVVEAQSYPVEKKKSDSE